MKAKFIIMLLPALFAAGSVLMSCDSTRKDSSNTGGTDTTMNNRMRSPNNERGDSNTIIRDTAGLGAPTIPPDEKL